MQSNQDSSAGGSDSQTVEVPLSACPDCKEGDTLEFKVVSVDQNSGTITMSPMESESSDKEGQEEGGSASDALANQVGDEENAQQQ